MTEKQVNKILDNFKYSLEDLLPERREQVGLLWLCIKEMFEELMYSDLTKMPPEALSYRKKSENNFDNILSICSTAIKLTKKIDLDNLLSAFGHLDARLFQIHLDALNARRKLNSIMNKIADKLPDDDE